MSAWIGGAPIVLSCSRIPSLVHTTISSLLALCYFIGIIIVAKSGNDNIGISISVMVFFFLAAAAFLMNGLFEALLVARRNMQSRFNVWMQNKRWKYDVCSIKLLLLKTLNNQHDNILAASAYFMISCASVIMFESSRMTLYSQKPFDNGRRNYYWREIYNYIIAKHIFHYHVSKFMLLSLQLLFF